MLSAQQNSERGAKEICSKTQGTNGFGAIICAAAEEMLTFGAIAAKHDTARYRNTDKIVNLDGLDALLSTVQDARGNSRGNGGNRQGGKRCASCGSDNFGI